MVNKSTSASHYMKRLYLANHCVSCLKNSTLAIKFTCNDSKEEINFLDDKKRLSRMGKTHETKISTNKTNIRLWTEFKAIFFFRWKIWNPCSPNTRATKKTSLRQHQVLCLGLQGLIAFWLDEGRLEAENLYLCESFHTNCTTLVYIWFDILM